LSFKAAAVGITAVSSLLWWNWNPVYALKEKKQEDVLKTLYLRISSNITLLNDILPRWSTSASFDKRTRRLLSQRTGWQSKLFFPLNDDMKPFRETSKSEKHTIKKIYK
jgi:hypothetical protein